MWKRGTTGKTGDLALQFAGEVHSRTRGALGPRVLLFALCPLALGTLAASPSEEQGLSPSAGRLVGAPHSVQAAPAITQVDIRGTAQEVIVRVEGDLGLTAHPFRLRDPERLVLDFFGARLALARASTQGARGPVRRVRVGQFKPDVARVVIDLKLAAPYLLHFEGKGVTVSFARATQSPALMGAAPARPVVPVHVTETSLPAPLSPAVEKAWDVLRPELGSELRGALANPVPPGTTVEPGENALDTKDEAGRQAHQKPSNSDEFIEPPVLGQRKEVTLAQLRREAEELARLAGSIPAQVEQVTQGKLPKDFAENLKRIDKLVKRLRAEVMP